MSYQLLFRSVIEILVLWARSESNGSAKIKSLGLLDIGMLEYWVLRTEIYFYMDDTDQKLKSGHHPLFIPLFHFSTMPPGI